jgi:NADH:ubiquinone reductase (non-electrogenic)
MSPPSSRLLIVGSGFAAVTLLKHLRARAYDVTVVSLRNHFLFTPLLPSTTVGTIEFRSIIEPIRMRRNITFLQAVATSLDLDRRTVSCANAVDGRVFSLPFDELVVAVGTVNNTFGVPGVEQHALFLKELRDARRIRQRLIDVLERSSSPNIGKEELFRLLHFVIVGGGPTGVEFAAELTDFLEDELTRAFPALVGSVRISLIEAGQQILSSFDLSIAEYATRLFNRRRVNVLTQSRVERVTDTTILLADGSSLPYGVLVWATGNGPTAFVTGLPFEKDEASRLLTDDHFRIPGFEGIYAVGDCATIQGRNLPATAQVAMQGGKYLALRFNRRGQGIPPDRLRPFRYRHLGMLAYIGHNEAVADLPGHKSRGFSTWVFWRSAYLTRLVSWKNKILVLFDWTKTMLFGRDVSRF